MAPTRRRRAAAERQLVLLSAATALRRDGGRAGARNLTDDIDWSRLADTLRTRRLLPTLGPRIVDLANGRASEQFAAAVAQALTAGRRQGAFLQLVCLRVIAALADAGIRSSALKGPLLGEAIYGDPARRLSSDIDLLVATEQLHEAVEVVRSLGYRAPTDPVDRRGLPLLHFLLVHESGELPPIELHWRVHWYERRFAREQLVPPVVEPLGGWRPSRGAELIGLLLFYARDGLAGLRLASDLSGWWDAYGAALSSTAVPDLLRDYPALTRVIVAAATAAESVVGLPAREITGELLTPDHRERLAARLANPSPLASEPQLYAEMGLVDGLLIPPGGFRGFVGRQLLPPSAVLDQHSRQASRSRARSPVLRCVGTLARYVATIPRLIRPSERLP